MYEIEPSARTEADQAAFVLEHTALLEVPLVPEVRVRTAPDITRLWEQAIGFTGNADAPPPFWAFVWVGGQALSRYILDHPLEVAGRRVGDIATGSGICAIAAAKAGAAAVTAFDSDQLAIRATGMNASANDVEVAVRCEDVLGGEPPTGLDVILAGDVCYERELGGRMIEWLRDAHTRGLRVLVGDPGRPHFPRNEMLRLGEYEVPTSVDLESAGVKLVGIYTFPEVGRSKRVCRNEASTAMNSEGGSGFSGTEYAFLPRTDAERDEVSAHHLTRRDASRWHA